MEVTWRWRRVGHDQRDVLAELLVVALSRIAGSKCASISVHAHARSCCAQGVDVEEASSYKHTECSYQRLAAPLKPRISPGLAATKGFCFVVGGTGSSLLQRACTSADNPWARSWGERLVDVSFGERGCWEPLPRGGEGDGTHVAACAGRGCVYAFGGLQTGKPSSQALRLDLRTGLWQPLPRLPTPRFECAAVFAHDLCIVAGGASVAGAATDVVEGFAPAEGKHGRWRSLPSLRQPRFAFAMVAAQGPSGQALYAIGGLCSGITLAVVERLDLSRPAAWELTEPLAQPRHHCGAATAAGKIFVFGGCNGTDAVAIPESSEPSGCWAPLAEGPEPWPRVAAVALRL
eukprot:s1487_g9.t1